MGWLDVFSGSTPAAIASETTSKTVGAVFTGLATIINEFHLSPEQELKLKIAVEEQRLEFYKAQTSDVQNARQMQIQTRSVWPGIISTLMLVGFFIGGGFILFQGLPKDITDIERMVITLFVQTLISGVTLVLGYWLGSSSSSSEKNAMLFNSQPAGK